MKWIAFLERISIALQLTLYTIFGLAPIAGGIISIYLSQSSYYSKFYRESLYLGMGIVSIIVGLFVGWVCLIKGVGIYRDYMNSKK